MMADAGAKPNRRILLTEEETRRIRRSIHVGSHLSMPYLIMNALATIVASFGLLADSTAVVIGAMIIAMLLGPIMGLALAMVDGDTGLLRRAIWAEAVGVVLVILIGYLSGVANPFVPLTDEIMSRTQPNLFDLVIALAGGAAGAYATVSPRVSVGIVGVAIATALVPPLASCGICLSRGMGQAAMGAFILFATNLVAIQCASSLVLALFGFRKVTQRQEDDSGYWHRLVIDGLAFITLAIFLSIQLMEAVGIRSFQREIRSQLQNDLKKIPGAFLSETRFIDEAKRRVVVAVVRTPNSITPEQTSDLESRLKSSDRRPVKLHVRSLLTKETTSDGYLHVIEPEAEPVDSPERGIDSKTEVLPGTPYNPERIQPAETEGPPMPVD